ncbi:MAG: hypothetical protein PHU25_08075 [Deltaproteobacteria bacterium]|nr:hypothetical protein [Deltaproteobacteria bacterium]
MPFTFPHESRALVRRLTYWIETLVRITREEERLVVRLADLGVIVTASPPPTSGSESPNVLRLKEELVRLAAERAGIERQIVEKGAVILDRHTLEIALPGGPKPGSVLSWQPGEPVIGWFRAAPDASSPRQPLPGADSEKTKPVLH